MRFSNVMSRLQKKRHLAPDTSKLDHSADGIKSSRNITNTTNITIPTNTTTTTNTTSTTSTTSTRHSPSRQEDLVRKPIEKRLPDLPAEKAGACLQQTVVRKEDREVVVVPIVGNDSASDACSHVPAPDACSTLIDRPHRPPTLSLARARTCGFTESPLDHLRQNIAEHACGNADIIEQFARPKPPKTRRKKTLALPAMGNHPSSLANDHGSDNSTSRNPVRVLRKSSTLLFNKRLDAKSPLPRPATAATIVVNEPGSEPSTPRVDARHGADTDDPFHRSATRARTPPTPVHAHRHLSDSDLSTDARMSSPTTTIKKLKRTETAEDDYDDDDDDDDDDNDDVDSDDDQVEGSRTGDSAVAASHTLSPTIPDIPALPEDTPHKYGLVDRMETTLMDFAAGEDANGNKAARRSSGVELFREATSLASASSFLNGLSISRRAAESTGSWTQVSSRSQSRPPSSGPARPSSTVQTPVNENSGRRSHELFKRTRFAYSRPLGITQLRCFRQHSKLVRTGNKSAPVECAICHVDDDQEHYSCSWCALRMCRYCQMDFSRRGMAALAERIKKAEMGSVSDDSSFEDVCRGRQADA